MRIALLGYGKMGKVIEELALERGHEISLKTSSETAIQSTGELKDTDLAIEFSTPDAAPENIALCLEAGIPIVVGTTGWYKHLERIVELLKVEEGRLFTATNFSLGVNVFFKLNEKLAQMMNELDQYEVGIEEIHHTEKLDAPSGTAITTAEIILDELKRKKNWKLDGKASDELSIQALRLPNVPGTHTVSYTSEIDSISLKHEAKNRKGFALGALLAAEWLTKQSSGVYGMENLLKL
ncbi:MAG TPA: 4-hydroxy-tetrahydrodipicolinate reductase [Flavobacteriales bacterium]|jgi:4-hydroxy-tetrahydrodipicolinate reductase|nr:4-hydroxy-tetrahydrodipicolinate reductase [Flavobacteriales bacterium]